MSSPNLQEVQGTFSRENQLALFMPTKGKIVSAAATLTVGQSGAVCLWNLAAGFTYTLPAITAADVGTRFRFVVTVTATSVAHVIATDAATTFLLGSLHMAIGDTTPGATAGPKDFPLNGTTHIGISQNGSTTGGLIGTVIDVLAISTTQWLTTGYVKGSGTIATPAYTA